MRILVACECSGVVREAFRAKGHNAWSCDLKPAEDNSIYHYQCDIREILDGPDKGQWDLLLAFPDCTYLSSSGLHWNTRNPERALKTQAAVDFALTCSTSPFLRLP